MVQWDDELKPQWCAAGGHWRAPKQRQSRMIRSLCVEACMIQSLSLLWAYIEDRVFLCAGALAGQTKQVAALASALLLLSASC